MLDRSFAPILNADLAVELVSVHDGDTFTVNVTGWDPIVGKCMPVRLFGVDAPELHDGRHDVALKALGARTYLSNLLHDQAVVLTSLRRDKYFRLLATVSLGGIDVATSMLKAGLVRPYPGFGPKPW